ncbi:unnamed protein product [Nesidiocoris tenuis]|uniref:Uncharacterized protein n=1 Tax=Nesidiocoris tenuis TaxID=355587 RepID=A0A6H5HA02_9HEMI|nr:unnamed protein product [Nesidiocoris tenuis]CAB0012525.1 unnamed protein product [Nesidiocoris tenuis]
MFYFVPGTEEEMLEADDDDARRAITNTKKSICLFLLQTLRQGVPNVAHYLFGFDLNKEIKKTVFQQPDTPTVTELRQMSWLLKTVAIEMRVTAANQQLSQLALLVQAYTGCQKDPNVTHTANETVTLSSTSCSVMLLGVDLRQAYISESGKGDETDSKLCNFMDSNHYKLTTVITNLVKWILSSGVAPQKVRANLYAALLNFLHLAREKSVLKKKSCLDQQNRRPDFVTLLDASLAGAANTTDRSYVDVVLAQGERLIDMLCHDCSTSHDICKMLALSCLDMIVEIDPTSTSLLSSRGYLKYIIDSLLEMDKQLIQLLSNNVRSLKALYVYESKMFFLQILPFKRRSINSEHFPQAFLCRIASTRIGAEMLLDQKVLACLSVLHYVEKETDELRTEATRTLTAQVEAKKMELQACHFIIEHCLYIVWAHLDYYMLRGLSNKTFGQAPSKLPAFCFWIPTCRDLSIATFKPLGFRDLMYVHIP